MFRVLVGAGVIVAGMIAYIWVTTPLPNSAAAAKQPPVVAVSVVSAQRQNVPVVLTGIGTVQALNTVQIKTRVDGALEQVNFQEGQRVHQGDVLAIIDQRLYKAALDQAKAKLDQDQAQLVTDQKDLDRNKTLITNQFASQQAVDQMTAKVGVDKALIEGDKAVVSSAQTNLDYTVIVAPFDGLMGLRTIDPGNIVHASDNIAIATLTQHEPIFVLFTLPEAQLPMVRSAMKAGDVPVTAFDPEGKKEIALGALRVIDNQIDQASGTIRLKAQFDNRDGALWPGQYTPVAVQVDTLSDAVTAPSSALQRGPGGLYVWLATPDQHAEMRAIEIGVSYQGATVVAKGLTDGEQVITSNQYRLQSNVKLRIDSLPQASNASTGRT